MTSPPTDPSSVRSRKLALAWSADAVPDTLKVAFATDNHVAVNQHFGSARSFAIYAVDAARARLVELAGFDEAAMDGNEDKLAARIDALNGCAAVYCLAVGGSAVRQLLAAGVQPVRMDDTEAIRPLLERLRTAIREGGVPWIDRHARKDAARFEHMAAQAWQE